jgi:long-chain fatty acid transport protein
MKRSLLAACIAASILVFCGPAFAQIDNLTNMSAEWVRMCNRNAATDDADIVVFNPAGLTSLSDGFHINVSNQILIRKPEHSFIDPLDPTSTKRLSYEQDDPDWFVPNLYASYKKDRWSVFGAIYLPGSAGAIDYPDGSITTRELGAALLSDPESPFYGAYTSIGNEHLKGTSTYLATSIGGAYKITDQISVAAGIRNISVDNTIKGGLTVTGGLYGSDTPDTPLKVHVEQEDNGWGGVLGIQLKPNDKLNLALHYESQVKLDLKTDIKGDDTISSSAGLYVDGEKNRRDFPAMIGMGASYQLTPEFRGEFDLNYWFQKSADWGKNSDGKDIANLAGDCWSIGVGGEYQATPQLEVSAGTLYTLFRWDDIDAYYSSNPGSYEIQYTNNVSLGAGVGYKIMPGLKLNFGLNYTWWESKNIMSPIGKVDMDNSTCIIAAGFDYSI